MISRNIRSRAQANQQDRGFDPFLVLDHLVDLLQHVLVLVALEHQLLDDLVDGVREMVLVPAECRRSGRGGKKHCGSSTVAAWQQGI